MNDDNTFDNILATEAEVYVKQATILFERVLHGLGKTSVLKIQIALSYSCVTESTYYEAIVSGLYMPEDISNILSRRCDTDLEAAKALALCACQFALYCAADELKIPHEEQQWMPETVAYWYKLKDEVIAYKNKNLIDFQ